MRWQTAKKKETMIGVSALATGAVNQSIGGIKFGPSTMMNLTTLTALPSIWTATVYTNAHLGRKGIDDGLVFNGK